MSSAMIQEPIHVRYTQSLFLIDWSSSAVYRATLMQSQITAHLHLVL